MIGIGNFAKAIEAIKSKYPIVDDVKRGYDSLTPEQKAELMKNILLIASKVAGKVAK